MAKRKPLPKTFEPEASYRVELARVVRFDGLRLRDEITLTGAAVTRLVTQEGADAVLTAERV